MLDSTSLFIIVGVETIWITALFHCAMCFYNITKRSLRFSRTWFWVPPGKCLRFPLVCMKSTRHLKQTCTVDKPITPIVSVKVAHAFQPQTDSSHVSINPSTCQYSRTGWGYGAKRHPGGVLFTSCSLNRVVMTNNRILEWEENCSSPATTQPYHSNTECITHLV